MSAPGTTLCGPNADDRYCALYWELSAERDRYKTALERLCDEDAWILDEGLGGNHREEHHVRANLVRQVLGLDVCGCSECRVSLGLADDGDERGDED